MTARTGRPAGSQGITGIAAPAGVRVRAGNG